MMDFKMEEKLMITVFGIILVALPVLSSTMKVKLSNAWKTDVGWVVTCGWKLEANDSLQSVRLYNNEQQFMIYRPQTDGEETSRLFQPIENVLQVECVESEAKGVEGSCVVTVELYQPMRHILNFSCEVSGERPKFMMDRKDIVISPFVPPTDAKVVRIFKDERSGRVELNCTSSGMPDPTLVWTIGERKVPHDFTSDRYWNVTSKLWHVWSQMSYTPSNEYPIATCTPEISRGRDVETGKPAQYNSASAMRVRNLLISTLLLLLR